MSFLKESVMTPIIWWLEGLFLPSTSGLVAVSGSRQQAEFPIYIYLELSFKCRTPRFLAVCSAPPNPAAPNTAVM